MRRLRTTLSLLGAATLAACADLATGPEPRAPFAIDARLRAELAGALGHAGSDASLGALADRAAAARIGAAFALVAEHVSRDDRDGARRAIAAARETIDAAREGGAADPAGMLQVEALRLVLAHAELLARDGAPGALYGAREAEARDESAAASSAR